MSDREPVPTEAPNGQRTAAWLSYGFEQLVHDVRKAGRSEKPVDFDIVIVGSGYGGAVAAAQLAGTQRDGRALSVCILERGKEYLPGMFPARVSELPAHIRLGNGIGRQEGGEGERLFDLRLGPDVCALMANGLGGGSLINAGVMLRPDEAVWQAGWPAELANVREERDRLYAEIEELLGAKVDEAPNTVARPGEPLWRPSKFAALARLAGEDVDCVTVPLSMAMTERCNSAAVRLEPCRRCADCMTGCNHGAKNSLDTNLLRIAARCEATRIFTGATVLRVERDEEAGVWVLEVVHTDRKLRERQGSALSLRGHTVILSAGTFGSTEILLRSQSEGFRCSRQLGRRFSTNGDNIAVVYGGSRDTRSYADEHVAPGEREIGPTITGMLRLSPQADGITIQELAIPAALRRMYEETVTTAATLNGVGEIDWSRHPPARDPCAVDDAMLERSSVVAMMGDDGAAGVLELVDDGRTGDAATRVRWPELSDHAVFRRQIAELTRLAQRSGSGAKVLPNPLWRLLPEHLKEVAGQAHGPVLTVHPLGGCSMGEDAETGVVNHLGQVFDPARGPRALHPNLFVLDGSIVPRALGINPALTIAMLALRSARWIGREHGPARTGKLEQETRPVFRPPVAATPFEPTVVQLRERMSGPVMLRGSNGRFVPCIVEFTLAFEDVSLRMLCAGANTRLRLNQAASGLRVYLRDEWMDWQRRGRDEDALAGMAQISASLSGSLTLFAIEPSRPLWRILRGLWAWLWNRGLRDSWQWLTDPRERKGNLEGGLLERAYMAVALASRAGAARTLDYDLTVTQVHSRRADSPLDLWRLVPGARIVGRKRLAYQRRSNPWRQLREMMLTSFPGMRPSWSRPVLELDVRYLAQQEHALFCIVGQRSQPDALCDLAAFGGYIARLMLMHQLWAFRQPDRPAVREPQRLPGVVSGLPTPEIKEIVVDALPDGAPVKARLTRYRGRGKSPLPVVLIHGYSASGTTFVHDAVRPNLAGYLWRRNRDIWVLDMRTSSGMPHAKRDWSFDQAAFADIPAAVDHICRTTGLTKVDVVAHCMGSVMFSMAVLGSPKTGEPFFAQRLALPERIRRVVLSQVGPVMRFSADNALRAYVMSYLRHFIPRSGYEFRPSDDPSLAEQLLDRLLATLPYPIEEFETENPRWAFWRRTPFVGTRHRMDALYGRDFSINNLSRRVLDHIDDLFGPLSLETVSQAIHFARLDTITNKRGQNVFVSRMNLGSRWIFPTLYVHGEDNGLTDVNSVWLVEDVLRDDAGLQVWTETIERHGHQDCLIGRHAAKAFGKIASFLDGRLPTLPAADPERSPFHLRIPYIGPILGARDEDGLMPIAAAHDPSMGTAVFALFVPIESAEDGRLAVPEGGEQRIALRVAMPDDHGWFRLRRAPQDERVLMLLLYSQSLKIAGQDFSETMLRSPGMEDCEFRLDGSYQKLGGSATGIPLLGSGSAAPVERITGGIRTAVGRLIGNELDSLLRTKSEQQLRLGVIEPRRAAKDGKTAFALASCQYPAGLLDAIPAQASYERMARLLAEGGTAAPQFLLLAGDQVYVDATAGLFDPSTLDDRYGSPYQRLFRIEPLRDVLRRVPVFMMLDDHEVEDDWEPVPCSCAEDPRLVSGRDAYLRFQRRAGPPRRPPEGDSRHPLWFSFVHNGVPFFVADTRTERSSRRAEDMRAARIMSDSQFAALKAWLVDNKDSPGPKFIVSACTVLPRKLAAARSGSPASALRSDSWDGFPASLEALLGWIADECIPNVVFLSGDEHISAVTRATVAGVDGPPISVYSIHSSPLYSPWRFDSTEEDFLSPDEWTFGGSDISRQYTCAARTQFYPGEGFAVVRYSGGAAHWSLSVDFERVSGETHPVTVASVRGPVERGAAPAPA